MPDGLSIGTHGHHASMARAIIKTTAASRHGFPAPAAMRREKPSHTDRPASAPASAPSSAPALLTITSHISATRSASKSAFGLMFSPQNSCNVSTVTLSSAPTIAPSTSAPPRDRPPTARGGNQCAQRDVEKEVRDLGRTAVVLGVPKRPDRERAVPMLPDLLRGRREVKGHDGSVEDQKAVYQRRDG